MEKLKINLKKQLIDQLNLEDIEPNEIVSEEPLFNEGLGLDSIDALEIIVLLESEYNIKIDDPKKGKEIMYSIDTLAQFIEKNRK